MLSKKLCKKCLKDKFNNNEWLSGFVSCPAMNPPNNDISINYSYPSNCFFALEYVTLQNTPNVSNPVLTSQIGGVCFKSYNPHTKACKSCLVKIPCKVYTKK